MCSLFASDTVHPPSSTPFPYTTLFRSSPPSCCGLKLPTTTRWSDGSRRPPLRCRTRGLRRGDRLDPSDRSEEHTSELQSVEISYAVFCLRNKKGGIMANAETQRAKKPV